MILPAIIRTSMERDFYSEIDLFDPLELHNATPFTPEPYVPSKDIVELHDSPRFGHTNNIETFITGLADENAEMRDNYILGVTAGAMIVFAIGLVWFMIIVGLKIAGPKKVGFLAGKLEHPEYDIAARTRDVGELDTVIEEDQLEASQPDVSSESRSLLESDCDSPLIITNTIDADYEAATVDDKFKKKVTAVRMTFVLSGLAMIVCGSLFYCKGMSAVRRSLVDISQGLQLVDDTANRAKTILGNVEHETNQLILEFNNTKASVGGDFCSGASAYAQEIRGQIDNLDEQMKTYKTSLDETAHQAVNDLDLIIHVDTEADDQLEKANIAFSITIAISIAIGVLIFAMLIMTYFSTKGVSNKCTKMATYAMLWPVFVFLLILFFIFALLFLVASIAGADFCYDPNSVVLWYLHGLEENADPNTQLLLDFATYYVSGCQTQNKPNMTKLDDIADLLAQMKTLTNNMRNMPASLLSLACGFSNAEATTLKNGIGIMHNMTNYLNQDMIDAQNLLKCETFNPIYTKFAYDALCTEGVDGLTWIFSSSLLLVIFAMLFIMFRAALYPVKKMNGFGLYSSASKANALATNERL